MLKVSPDGLESKAFVSKRISSFSLRVYALDYVMLAFALGANNFSVNSHEKDYAINIQCKKHYFHLKQVFFSESQLNESFRLYYY